MRRPDASDGRRHNRVFTTGQEVLDYIDDICSSLDHDRRCDAETARESFSDHRAVGFVKHNGG
jgi:hypothetical protein